jgi:hypothetical protein
MAGTFPSTANSPSAIHESAAASWIRVRLNSTVSGARRLRSILVRIVGLSVLNR